MDSYLNKFRSYFGVDVPDAPSAHVLCPWHNDKDPSLHLNIETGKYHCYGCGKSGSIDELLTEVTIIDEEVVSGFHSALMKEPEMIAFLGQTRRISTETIKKYKIGYNGGRFSLPVRDEDGQCVNIRLYKPGDKTGSKVVSYSTGFGNVRWFPWPPRKDEDTVAICEGEMDTLLARQCGVQAYTATCGAGTWNDSLTPFLYGKDVVICYDVDSAGRNGAKKLMTALRKCTRRLRDVVLPMTGLGKDFTDWVIAGGTHEDWTKIIETTPSYVRSEAEDDLGECATVRLWDATKAQYTRKPIECDVVVAGKDPAPYLVPLEYKIECARTMGPKVCNVCGASSADSVRVRWKDGEILGLVDTTEFLRDNRLREQAGVPMACKQCKVSVLRWQNVECLTLLPAFDPDSDGTTENKYTYRMSYFLGTGVTTNSRYTIRGVCVPHKVTQVAVIVAAEAIPSQKDLAELIDRQEIEVMRFERIDQEIAGMGYELVTSESVSDGERAISNRHAATILQCEPVPIPEPTVAEGMARHTGDR